MSLRATSWAWTVPTSPTCKLVLVALADHADEVGHCWPSVARVVEMTGLSERAIRTALATLEAEERIQLERSVGRGRTSRYALRINHHPEKVQQVQVLAPPEKVHVLPEKVQQVPQKVQHVPEKVQQVHPNRKEPSENRKEEKKEVALRAPGPSVTLPDWMPADAWNLFNEHRERISRKTWTPAAINLTIRDLGRFRDDGMDPAAILEQSVANGWRGVFPLKSRPKQAPGKLDWWINDMKSGAIGR